MEIIPKPVALICEGSTDKIVLTELCEKEKFGNITIIDSCGVDRFPDAIATILRETRPIDLTRIAVVCDADKSFESRRESILKVFRQFDLPLTDTPGLLSEKRKVNTKEGKEFLIDTAYFILPDNASSGNLEGLLFSTLDEKTKGCIDKFIVCAEFNDPVRLFKAKIAAYMAISVRDLYKTLNYAIKENIFNFDNQSFGEIKKFLKLINRV